MRTGPYGYVRREWVVDPDQPPVEPNQWDFEPEDLGTSRRRKPYLYTSRGSEGKDSGDDNDNVVDSTARRLPKKDELKE
ncbi:MAG: hypothetical protein H6774_04305 [Pseudomonadales bacterium]|nr:hypothetical protein [Candidatus Woesebacteria bacterium]MCB9802282.1 hypothetical protein [Pseudomonadales bacterium]